MINTREFRIGNLLIEKKSGQIIEVINISQKHVSFSGQFKAGWKAEPIPLTEEWLLRFGFEKMDETWYTHKNYNLELDERGFWLSFQTLQLSEIINFVHQLQNLNFALTKQELKLNDK